MPRTATVVTTLYDDDDIRSLLRCVDYVYFMCSCECVSRLNTKHSELLKLRHVE